MCVILHALKIKENLQTNEIEICIYIYINIKSLINATVYKTSLVFHRLDQYFEFITISDENATLHK